MATFYDALTDELRGFIAAQPVFFTGTAPAAGRINVSPKGMDTFRCLDAHTAGYLDLTGSGNETAAHIGENGRLTFMFCSFKRRPLILRLYGRGEIARHGSDRWEELLPHFDRLPGARQIVLMHIESVQTSCGYGVPVMGQAVERSTLVKWASSHGEDTLIAYREANNVRSIDGIETASWMPGEG